jgi:hypothetical protein
MARGQECRRIDLTSAPTYDDDDGKASFSAVKVLDLYPWIVLPPARGRPGERKEFELRFFGPNGHLYQSTSFSVAAGSAAHVVSGYSRPVPATSEETVPHKGIKRRIVAAPPLPVAGTSIVTSSLYGQWRIEAWMPGGRRPACARTFRLRP